MRRTLWLFGLIWILFFSISLAQTTPDEPKPRTDRSKTERVKKSKAEVKKDADKSTAEKEAEKEAAETDATDEDQEVATETAEANSAQEDEENQTESAEEKQSPPEEEKTPPKKEQKTSKKPPAAKKPKVVSITLRGEYPEGPTTVDLFSEMRLSLSELIERLDAAAKDKDVAAVWLKMDDPELGRGKVNEIRAAIARLRKAKKPVYAELTTAEASLYLVASACDEIMMPESGMLLIPGVHAEIMFYKGLLDKIGVEFEDLKMGKYKGGLEPLTRREMSEPLRESLEALIDDTYNDLAETVAADRGLNELVVKSLMDHGLFKAQAAKEAGLIDQVIYADQFEDSLRKKLKTKDVEIVTNYKSKGVKPDFSGISGFMKFVEIITGGGVKVEVSSPKDKIAVVYAVGPIMEGKSSSELFGERTLGSASLIAALRKAAENPKVVAIVLRIDSPGGSATASDLIWRETVRLEKPLIASMGNIAGSGGYYIAMGAKKIYAEPGTLTGSIGVLGAKIVLKGLYEKLGLNTEIISRGANSGSFSPTQHFTPEQRRLWMEMLEDTYHQFVSKAAKGRKMSYEKLEALAQGRVYTGRMAKKIGLVDEIGALDDAVIAAKVAAGLKPDADVEIIILPRPKSLFEQLFSDPTSEVETDAKLALPLGLDIPGQIKAIRQFFAQPVMLWMPFKVELK